MGDISLFSGRWLEACCTQAGVARYGLLRRHRSPAGSRRPSRKTVFHTRQKFGQFQPVPELQKQLSKSNMHAKRLRDLGQTFTLAGVGIAPSGPAFQFIPHVSPSFGVCFDCEFIPDIFDPLQSFKPAQMFNGLKCGFHTFNSGTIWRQYRLPTRVISHTGGDIHAHYQRFSGPRR